MLPVQLMIPFRNQIVQGAACHHTGQLHSRLAERYATIHAAGSLEAPLFFTERGMEFIEGLQTNLRRYDEVFFSVIFQKSCWFSHCVYSICVL